MNLEKAMAEARETFFAESRELLESLEDTLLRLEEEPTDAETLNALFRVAHTIKGSAGLFELHRIVGFTHVLESVLDRARAGDLLIDREMTALLLQCRDHIATLLDEVIIEDVPVEAQVASCARGEELVSCLRACLGDDAPIPESLEADPGKSEGGEASPQQWQISARFGADTFRNGMDPLSIVRYLGTLGEVISMTTHLDQMPAPDDMDAESCYLCFDLSLQSDCSRETLAEAFDFVRDDCVLQIEAQPGQLETKIEQIKALPDELMPLGEMLVRSGSVTSAELADGLARQTAAQLAERQPLGEILREQQGLPQSVLNAALEKQQQVRERQGQTQDNLFIRVRADKLDRLINLVGELVVSGAGISLRAQRNGDLGLLEAAEGLSGLVERIRDDALQLRMVPIADTFRRFNRVVRDTSHELGKDITLEIEGADNELDKSMVEKLTDSLTHLIRNAMDHGIEMPELRRAAGKPEGGRLRLAARHESGSFVIEISDDGAGLNRERILAKALERGLAQAGRDYPDAEVWQFIFAPGFSTASALTNLSGRGVGMDVVRRSIEALRGSVEIDSQLGLGTRITLRLPLTLAIIDGFIVGVGKAQYVIPLDMVVECIELSSADQVASHSRSYVNLRGEVLPFLRLREVFGLAPAEGEVRENIVVVQYGKQRAGLVVDELLGEFQTVIRPLSRLFQKLRGIAGSTILGSGEVALILDVPAMVQRNSGQESEMQMEIV